MSLFAFDACFNFCLLSPSTGFFLFFVAQKGIPYFWCPQQYSTTILPLPLHVTLFSTRFLVPSSDPRWRCFYVRSSSFCCCWVSVLEHYGAKAKVKQPQCNKSILPWLVRMRMVTPLAWQYHGRLISTLLQLPLDSEWNQVCRYKFTGLDWEFSMNTTLTNTHTYIHI